MRKTLFILFALVFTFAATGSYAQRIKNINPSGQTVSVERTVKEFKNLSVSTGIRVELAQSDVQNVTVKTDKNALDYIKTDVRNGTLYISYADRMSFNRISTVVFVTAPELHNITGSSGSTIEIKGILGGSALSMVLSSAATISGKINLTNLNINASSGSEVSLSGMATNLTTVASSGSSIAVQNIDTTNTTVTTSSGSVVKVYAGDSLNVTASSGSIVHYYGSPGKTNINSSSGATIAKK